MYYLLPQTLSQGSLAEWEAIWGFCLVQNFPCYFSASSILVQHEGLAQKKLDPEKTVDNGSEIRLLHHLGCI